MGLCKNKKKEDCPKYQRQQELKKRKRNRASVSNLPPTPGIREVNGVKYRFG